MNTILTFAGFMNHVTSIQWTVFLSFCLAVLVHGVCFINKKLCKLRNEVVAASQDQQTDKDYAGADGKRKLLYCSDNVIN